jgi:hypothetical protein
MSHPESFLTRWSRRKHAANVAGDESTASIASSEAACPQDIESEPAVETEPAAESECQDAAPPRPTPHAVEPAFDPLSVPPIESIGADTDIRGFLAAGVPPELTRAALRRAWAADPKIRDFVGLADYDWDFNAPGTMAGFGSLEMTDALQQVTAQIIGQMSSPDQTDATDQAPHKADQRDRADQSDLMAPTEAIAREAQQTGTAEDAPVPHSDVPSPKPLASPKA